MLLYADDIIIFADSAEGLQNGLNILSDYCQKWKLTVNKEKTKIMVFRKGGRLPNEILQTHELEITSHFSYLGIVFSTGGSFSQAQTTLSGQARTAIYKLNK